MFLHLHDGPAPLNTAENPLAPGAKPYSYEVGYPTLGQASPTQIVLPNDLYQRNTEGYVQAPNQILSIYQQIKTGVKRDPAKDVGTTATGQPTTLAGFWASVLQYCRRLFPRARPFGRALAAQALTRRFLRYGQATPTTCKTF